MDMWILVICLISLIEIKPSLCWSESVEDDNLANSDIDFPLTRSLGYSLTKKLKPNLADDQRTKNYQNLYHEMLKISHDSRELLSTAEERDLESYMGKDRMQFMKKDVLQRRRKTASARSSFGRRRSRSQAWRLDRLNSQSLKSHQEHTALRDPPPDPISSEELFHLE